MVIQSSKEFLEQERRDQQQAQAQAQVQVQAQPQPQPQPQPLTALSIIKEDNEQGAIIGELRKRNNQDRNAYIEGNDFKVAINPAMDK